MGLEIKTQTTVDATRERVFAYLADFGRHPEWAQPRDQLRINAPRDVHLDREGHGTRREEHGDDRRGRSR
jgi:uncharacterized protein YndB with AHSA1/START domain